MDVQLCLPLLFTSFLDGAKNEMWSRLFQGSVLFDTKRQKRDSYTLFIDSLTLISNIFYLLQTLAPSMLLIVHMDEIDGYGEVEMARVLLSVEWVKDHKSILQQVFGSEERYQLLVAATTSKSFQTEISRYSWSDDYDNDSYYTNSWGVREPLDYQACGSSCGFCGCCEY
jgi:hypothetical protein